MGQSLCMLGTRDTKTEKIKMIFLIQRAHRQTINWSPDSHQNNLSKTQICTDLASEYKPFL